MDNEHSSSRLDWVLSVLRMNCPKCRKTKLFEKPGYFVFRSTFKMPVKCSNCAQVFEIEPGFWYGALWASYPLLIIVEFPFLIMALLKTWGNHWSPLIAMIAAFFILWPAFVRLGRSLWIHFWVKYKPTN